MVTLTGKQWQITYGGSKGDTLQSMVNTPDGGYLLAGTSASPVSGDKSDTGKGNTDFWVVKMNATGQKVWDKTYGGSNPDRLSSLIAVPGEGYILGGSSSSNKSGDKSQNSKGGADYWLVKIDENGNKVWDKSFGGNANDRLAVLLASPEGGFLVGGTSASDKSGDKSQASRDNYTEAYFRGDYWVIKLDANGNKEWDKTYGGQVRDNLTAMILKPGGGYVLGGSSSSGISGDKTQSIRGLRDYWIIQITEQGNKVWDKTYGGISGYGTGDSFFEAGSSHLRSILATPDGGYLLAGSSSAFKGEEKSSDSPVFYADIADYWLVKIDQNGKKLWDKTYGGASNSNVGETKHDLSSQTGDSQLKTIIQLQGGGYLLAGTSNADNGRDKTENNRSDIPVDQGKRDYDPNLEITVWNDYWLVKIDEKGQVVEDRTIGGTRNDLLAAVLPTKEGNLLVGGTSFSGIGADKTTISKGEADYWILKVSTNRTEEPPFSAWDANFGWLKDDDLTDVIKTSDGGYLSGGISQNYSNGQAGKNYWIFKTDKNGRPIWNKVYGGTADDYLNRIIQTQDGGYLLAGSSLSNAGVDKSENSRGDRDYWIIKMDAQGNKQWDKTLGGSGYDELKKVIQLASGEYILAGSSNSPISNDKTQGRQGGTDYWLVKISTTGNKIWDKRYGGSLDETLGSFTLTPEGGFLLAGTSLSGNGGDKSEPSRGNRDYWVVKTDKDGNLLWEKTYGGSGADEAYSIARNGIEYFISGTSTSGKNGEKSQVSQGGKDYWLIKIDSQGNKLWDKTFGGNQDDELQASTRLNSGHIVLGGSSYSSISGTKTQASRGKSDFWIVEVDANGKQMYDKRFGGKGKEELRTVFQTSDGGLLLGGRSDSNINGEHSYLNKGGNDYWLVKLAPETTSSIATREVTPIEELVTITNSLTAYPNPFQGKVTVKFSLPQTQVTTVKIFDSQGREVITLFQEEAKARQTYQLEWQAGIKPAGLYFIQLQTPTLQEQQKLLFSK
ncbi:T9SS type A sorting domain-containing protein [Adhaeribacter radiodurans]|uniref:T9SS type A sorting domain-containing protein n=1 Tax=Adhaeribacter radiodurans TaxID=2745197 RepID=A0A7L7LAU2_9BACT|nr:T9SS type A sorting domain-containing protein [Adhaeribacter radiodurans]QMU29529.1 T9SS type A sorting domain-containing protein [Adhaeribacter radiodurans]